MSFLGSDSLLFIYIFSSNLRGGDCSWHLLTLYYLSVSLLFNSTEEINKEHPKWNKQNRLFIQGLLWQGSQQSSLSFGGDSKADWRVGNLGNFPRIQRTGWGYALSRGGFWNGAPGGRLARSRVPYVITLGSIFGLEYTPKSGWRGVKIQEAGSHWSSPDHSVLVARSRGSEFYCHMQADHCSFVLSVVHLYHLFS